MGFGDHNLINDRVGATPIYTYIVPQNLTHLKITSFHDIWSFMDIGGEHEDVWVSPKILPITHIQKLFLNNNE